MSHSSSAEVEAEKNQEQLMKDVQEQVRSLEEENDVQQQVQCPPCEGGPETSLLSAHIGKGLW